MAQTKIPDPVVLILAAISRHEVAIQWARSKAEEAWGELVLESPPFPFEATRFYEPTMGPGLRKQFFAFEQLIDPAELVAIKLQTNQWEQDYRALRKHQEPRPLNLDPGYISEAKLVLATTKDRDHRLYLGRGIFGEVTLYYQRGRWQSRPWTYPDFRDERYHQFFQDCRRYLRQCYGRQD